MYFTRNRLKDFIYTMHHFQQHLNPVYGFIVHHMNRIQLEVNYIRGLVASILLGFS